MTPDHSTASTDDFRWMAHALQLAEQGLYTTTPNPRVGCVIVKQGQLVGQGWHRKAGEPHAEVLALREAGEQARGATAYVTLEPCSHYGRTPPCADALIQAGLCRIVIAMQDPNPLVSGQGIARLNAAGIATVSGVLEQPARELNRGFISRMTRQRPWLTVKTASSLDGRTALANGDSQWITGEAARRDGHRWRARSCAVLTGIGTVLADDPQLNVRGIEAPRQPDRIVLDTHLRTPPTARILQAERCVIVHGEQAPKANAQRLADQGAILLPAPLTSNARLDLTAVLHLLAGQGYNEILSEAGASLNGAFLTAGLADEWLGYLAPSLLGNTARGLFDWPALDNLNQQIRLHVQDIARIGNDWRIICRLPAPQSEQVA